MILSEKVYVASDQNVKIQTLYRGIIGWLKGRGFTETRLVLEDGEKGRVFFHGRKGPIASLNVQKDAPILVNQAQILAHTGNIHFQSLSLREIKTYLLSGDGFVCQAKGDGILYLGSANSSDVPKKQNAFQDPLVWMNRITLIALVYLTSHSPYLKEISETLERQGNYLTDSIRYLGGMIFLSKYCELKPSLCQSVFNKVIHGTTITLNEMI